jgi:hypothetical protein
MHACKEQKSKSPGWWRAAAHGKGISTASGASLMHACKEQKSKSPGWWRAAAHSKGIRRELQHSMRREIDAWK